MAGSGHASYVKVGIAAAGSAEEREHLAARDGEADVPQDRASGVSGVHMLQLDGRSLLLCRGGGHQPASSDGATSMRIASSPVMFRL